MSISSGAPYPYNYLSLVFPNVIPSTPLSLIFSQTQLIAINPSVKIQNHVQSSSANGYFYINVELQDVTNLSTPLPFTM